MVFTPAEWVNDSVKLLIAEREQLESQYSDADRECWRRMATDSRMKSVFSSKYLKERLTPIGWRIWFDCAGGADKDGFKEERERLKNYAALMLELDESLAKVSEVIEKIHALDISEANQPREMFDPLLLINSTVDDCKKSGNSNLSYLFGKHVRPVLAQLSQRYDSRYIPSVPQMLSTLSERVSFAAINLKDGVVKPGCPIAAAALSSRQHAPLPEYVRAFDEAMRWYEDETGGADFLVPAEVMAAQAMVALDINEVDKKQITSARKY